MAQRKGYGSPGRFWKKTLGHANFDLKVHPYIVHFKIQKPEQVNLGPEMATVLSRLVVNFAHQRHAHLLQAVVIRFFRDLFLIILTCLCKH